MIERKENTRISSWGDPATRRNEITADDLAIMRDYIIHYDYGVMGDQSFKIDVSGSTVTVSAGTMFAYGYCGFIEEPLKLYLIPPSVPQFYIIYAELNRSVIPNTFKISALNNQGSIEVNLRQDVLNSVRTGIFQLPLWRVRIYYTRTETASGITVKPTIDSITDLREIKNGVEWASNVDNTKVVVSNGFLQSGVLQSGFLQNGVRAESPGEGNNSARVATTAFVDRTVKAEINR